MSELDEALRRWAALRLYWPRLHPRDQELIAELAQRLHDNPSSQWDTEDACLES